MRRLLLTLALLLAVASPVASESSAGLPASASDPPCASGDYFLFVNTTDNAIKKCENGTIIYVGAAAATSTSNGPKGGTYDPDRAPTSGTYGPCTDEFKNGASTGTWSWGNQSSATTTLAADYLKFNDVNDAGTHAYVCAPDNSADWTMTARLLVATTGSPGNAGLVFIDGGSVASPTLVVGAILRRTGTTTGDIFIGTKAAWTTTTWTLVSTSDTVAGPNYTDNRFPFCVQARYVVSTKVMTMQFSTDCRNWELNATQSRTFTNHPGAAGIGIESPASGTTRVTVQWIRTRTDSAGTSGEYLVGQ